MQILPYTSTIRVLSVSTEHYVSKKQLPSMNQCDTGRKGTGTLRFPLFSILFGKRKADGAKLFP